MGRYKGRHFGRKREKKQKINIKVFILGAVTIMFVSGGIIKLNNHLLNTSKNHYVSSSKTFIVYNQSNKDRDIFDDSSIREDLLGVIENDKTNFSINPTSGYILENNIDDDNKNSSNDAQSQIVQPITSDSSNKNQSDVANETQTKGSNNESGTSEENMSNVQDETNAGSDLDGSNLSKQDENNKPLEASSQVSEPIEVKLIINEFGFIREVTSPLGKVSDVLKKEGINIDSSISIVPEPTTEISENMTITLVKKRKEVIEETGKIPFDTKTVEDENLEQGKELVTTEGIDGEKKLSIEVNYENDKEVGRSTIKEEVVKQPTTKVISKGTKKVVVESPTVENKEDENKNESTENIIPVVNMKYSKMINCESTAYYAGPNASTATGTIPRHKTNDWSTIAVDPNVIPLGTKVYVEGYGLAIAEDTGGAIKGNIVDVFFDTNDECIVWGRRYDIKVYILE